MTDVLIRRATRAYHRLCGQRGWIPQQPCNASSEATGGRVVLRNVNGDLASYRLNDGGKLVRLMPQ